MSDIHETALSNQEEQDDIFYKEYPYYWLVTAYRINVEVYFHWEIVFGHKIQLHNPL